MIIRTTKYTTAIFLNCVCLCIYITDVAAGVDIPYWFRCKADNHMRT